MKEIYKIQGMHCRSCEVLIKEKLLEIPGVTKAHVNYKRREALVYSDLDVNKETIENAIIEAGYSVGHEEDKPWISTNVNDYRDLGIALIALLALYFLAKAFGLFNISIISSNTPSNLFVVALVGLTAGISTCMAMVGGLVLAISAEHSLKHPTATAAQKFRPHLFFNLGRVVSFFVLGGLIGLIGKAFQFNGPSLGILTIIVALIMFSLGLQLIGIFPRLSSGFALPSKITELLGIKKRKQKEYSHFNSALTGALTFFLPCGFTQAMQLYAVSTGNFLSGAMIMGIFALGTAPGLLGVGGLTSIVKGNGAKKFFRFTGLLVIALAVFNLSNGFNLTGWKIALSSSSVTSTVDDPNVKIENGVQVVRMDQIANGYSPNKFTIKKGIPVKWIIDSKYSGSCSASIIMPKLKIRKFLTPGENTIEFTANETGDMKFSCIMGMYTGLFTVVENTSSQGSGSPVNVAQASGNTPSPQPTPTAAIASPSPEPIKSQSTSNTDPAPVANSNSSDVQLIKTTYLSPQEDISPNQFDVKADQKVRFEISANADGLGCMGSIMIPGLVNKPEFLQKDQTIVFEFTPKKGVYDITCAMGTVRGIIYAS